MKNAQSLFTKISFYPNLNLNGSVGSNLLIPRVLILSSELLAKVAKTDPLVTPIGQDAYITFGDLQQLNWKLNAAFVAIIAWFLIQAWESHKKSKDTTSEDIKSLIKAVERIETRLQHTPTFRDLHNERE